MNDEQSKRVTLGQIVGLHGVRGSVKILSYTRPRDNIFTYRSWWLCNADGCQLYELDSGRSQGRGLVADIAGIEDRDAAHRLIGMDIAVGRDELPTLPAGEYYWFDLVGLEVVTCEGESLGQIVKLEETGANDVLVIRNRAGEEQLIPYVADRYVQSVDIDAGTLTVDWSTQADA